MQHMQQAKQYVPFERVSLPDRQWPDKIITKAPIWCSVDLRDGNQALVTPMGIEEKLTFFHTLVDVGFKEIEVGFPSASETEYEIFNSGSSINFLTIVPFPTPLGPLMTINLPRFISIPSI